MDIRGSKKIDILGVQVDALTVDELHREILKVVRAEGHQLVLHANAHGHNMAVGRPEFRAIMNSAKIVFCDGAGVMLAAKILGSHIPERITYADWMPRLARFAEGEGLSFFFLGGKPGVAVAAAEKLRVMVPGVRIAGCHDGYFDLSPNSAANMAVVGQINSLRPDILLVGMGMPLQEFWLRDNWGKLDARVALTGGAVFDYTSGALKRGPAFLTDHGFEWLGRLAIEPRRLWRRYVIGNPVFLARVLRQRLMSGRA